MTSSIMTTSGYFMSLLLEQKPFLYLRVFTKLSLRVCARFLKLSECEKILTFRLDFVKNFQLQFYFPEDENSTRQTGRVT